MRRATLTSSFTKGVLDPALSERIDLAHYYQSLAAGENAIVYPQGGVGDRGGLVLCSDADVLAAGLSRRLRRRLEPVLLDASMITAPNGGTRSALVDQDVATLFQTNAVDQTPFVLAEIDLGAAERIGLVDVERFSCAGTPVNDALGVEWWDGAAWQQLGASLDAGARRHLRTSPRTRRFAGWPGSEMTARHLRVVAVGAVGAGAISIGGVRLWREGSGLSQVRLINVAKSDEESYDLAITERNVDVFVDQRWQASIAIPHTSEEVYELTKTGAADTMILWHPDVEPPKLQRQGSAAEWDASPVPFEHIPDVPSGAAFVGDQNEIQQLTVPGLVAGERVVLFLGPLATAAITYADAATFAAGVASALGALPGVTAGDITVASLGGGVYRVEMIDGNGNRAWPRVSAVVLGRDARATTAVLQPGLDADAKLFGARSGWPRCGAFVQSRMLVGGMRAAPSTLAVSMIGLYFDFNTGFDYTDPDAPTAIDPLTADYGFVRTLDVDEVETIQAIYVGRHVQIFTDAGEWYIETRTLDPTAAFNVVLATRNGVEAAVPLVFADGATVFTARGGRTLRDLLWRDVEQSYGADPLNLLAPHLLTQVVDVAHRSARSASEGNRIWMINADGSMAMLTLLRGQDVVAMCGWSTPAGLFRAVMTDTRDRVQFAVERGGDLWLELWDTSTTLDAATRSSGAARTAIAGNDHLDGRDVWAIADGGLIGPLECAGGVVHLDEPAEDVTVGLAPVWSMTPQPVRERLQNAQPFRSPSRIYEIELAVEATGGLTFAANGRAPVEVSLVRSDGRFVDGGMLQTADGGAAQLPMADRLYTGFVRLQGIVGFVKYPYFTIGRRVPAPVKVKSARIELATNG